jgi:stearoyl-CoA desaturase (delta-9 desaturase)
MISNTETAPKRGEYGTLSWINVAFFGAFHALALLAPWFFSWSALGVAIFLHWLFGSIGICLGYHRLLTHRSLQVPKPLEYAITFIGSLALQGGPIFWVAGHRMHHLHTEMWTKILTLRDEDFGGVICCGCFTPKEKLSTMNLTSA